MNANWWFIAANLKRSLETSPIKEEDEIDQSINKYYDQPKDPLKTSKRKEKEELKIKVEEDKSSVRLFINKKQLLHLWNLWII